MRTTSSALLLSSLVIGLPLGTAHASEDRSMTVLSITSEEGNTSQSELFYNALRTQVEYHADLDLADVPAQDVDELLLAMGCLTFAECVEPLHEVLGTQWLAWGSLASAPDERTTLTFHLWDMEEGVSVRTRTFTLDDDALQEHADVLARSLLYDEHGTLTITSDVDGASVFLNDERVGQTPLVLSDRDLGVYRLRVEAEDRVSLSSHVTIDLADSEFNANLLPLSAIAGNGPGAARANGVTSWTLIGMGAAGLAAGGIFGMQSSNAQSDLDALIAQPTFDATRANDLSSEGNSATAKANMFMVGGATLLVSGGLLRALQRNSNDDSDLETTAQIASERRGFFVRMKNRGQSY